MYTNVSSSLSKWGDRPGTWLSPRKICCLGGKKARGPSGRKGPHIGNGVSPQHFPKLYSYDVWFLCPYGNCPFKQNIQVPISSSVLIRKSQSWLFLQSCGFLTPWSLCFFPTQYPHEVNGTPMYLYEVATESVCESAARLLFMSIKWAKSVPAFSTLSLQDQV